MQTHQKDHRDRQVVVGTVPAFLVDVTLDRLSGCSRSFSCSSFFPTFPAGDLSMPPMAPCHPTIPQRPSTRRLRAVPSAIWWMQPGLATFNLKLDRRTGRDARKEVNFGVELPRRDGAFTLACVVSVASLSSYRSDSPFRKDF